MATPTARQVQLATRGTIVRGVDLVMAELQSRFPRRQYLKLNGEGERVAVEGEPWRRGGTSPSGANMAGPIEDGAVPSAGAGNYFIGWPEMKTDVSMPHRAIWTPPGPGEERYTDPQQYGFVVDEVTATEVILRPPTLQDTTGITYQSRVGGTQPAPEPVELRGSFSGPIPPGRRMGGRYVAAAVATRIIPMRVTLWCADIDDAEELGGHLAGAAETVWQGAAIGVRIVESSGFLPDEKGTNGIHYRFTVNFAAPVVWAPLAEAEFKGLNPVIRFV